MAKQSDRVMVEIESPFEDFPGKLLFPKWLTPSEFMTIWSTEDDESNADGKERPQAFDLFNVRCPYMTFEMEGVPSKASSYDDIPSAAIVHWAVREFYTRAIAPAMHLKN